MTDHRVLDMPTEFVPQSTGGPLARCLPSRSFSYGFLPSLAMAAIPEGNGNLTNDLFTSKDERHYVRVRLGMYICRKNQTRRGFLVVIGSHSGLPGADPRVAVAEVLRGLEIHPLEPGTTALEAFVLIKVLDAEGDVSWCYRTTNRLIREELLGALVVQVDVLRKGLRDEWDDSAELPIASSNGSEQTLM